MSFIKNLLNPPPTNGELKDYYGFFNSTFSAIDALNYSMNPSVLTNANFATLGPGGLTPITPGDGDGAEFMANWRVFGAANAAYIITPTPYAANATIPSASSYFVGMTVSSATGGPFYFYQRQLSTVRKYQRNFLTYTPIIQNNGLVPVWMRCDIYSYYDTDAILTQGSTFFAQPGLTNLSCQIARTQSLLNKTVGAGNYTEFRINFLDFPTGTGAIEFYQIKCEFGRLSTLLQQ